MAQKSQTELGGLLGVLFGPGDIPAADRQRLVDAFKRAGNPNPTEADLLAAWYRARAR